MQEEETIGEFNARLCDIANEAFGLGEKMSEEKLVRKKLRSLPKRFAYKVTAVEEEKDVRNMKLEELIGSLQTFEMNFEEEHGDSRDKGIALKTKADSNEVETKFDEDEELGESMELLTKNLGRVMKGLNRRSSGSGPQSGPGNSQNTRNFNPQRKYRDADTRSDSKNKNPGIQCRECHGFGHIQSECPNFLKKNNKSYNVSWSDGDSDGSRDEGDYVSNHVALTTRSVLDTGTHTGGLQSVSADGPVREYDDQQNLTWTTVMSCREHQRRLVDFSRTPEMIS